MRARLPLACKYDWNDWACAVAVTSAEEAEEAEAAEAAEAEEIAGNIVAGIAEIGDTVLYKT